MNKKTLIIAIGLTLLSMGLAFFLITAQENNVVKNPIGNFLFEKTNKEGINVTKIVVKAPELQVSLYYENKFWHIKEADGYFADLVTINKLFQDISNAKIEAVDESVLASKVQLEIPTEQENDNAGFEIQTYNEKNQLLDSVIIGKKKNNFRYAKTKSGKQIYLISGDFELPKKMYYWLQQPLISIMPENIESLIIQTDTGQQLAYRIGRNSSFFNLKQQKTNPLPLLERFVLFNFIDVKKIQNTPLNNGTADKIIVLFPYSGLIYGIEIFKIDADFWVKIDLSITKLPTKVASDYIKDSQMLYNGWAFKINQNLGQYLMDYKIN